MSRRAPAAAASALLCGALALGGCGGTVVDDAKAEDAVEADIERSLGVEVRSVECPSGVDVEPGRTFDCTVTAASGDEARAVLRILNEDADVRFVDLRPVG